MGKLKIDTTLQIGDRVTYAQGLGEFCGRVVAATDYRVTIRWDDGSISTEPRGAVRAEPDADDIARLKAEIQATWRDEESHRVEAYRDNQATMPHVAERQIVLPRRRAREV